MRAVSWPLRAVRLPLGVGPPLLDSERAGSSIRRLSDAPAGRLPRRKAQEGGLPRVDASGNTLPDASGYTPLQHHIDLRCRVLRGKPAEPIHAHTRDE